MKIRKNNTFLFKDNNKSRSNCININIIIVSSFPILSLVFGSSMTWPPHIPERETTIELFRNFDKLRQPKVSRQLGRQRAHKQYERARFGSDVTCLCTAVTIRPHSAVCSPFFWDLAPGCSKEEDYSQLANYYINELDQYKVHVFAFCTDGLASQKGALTKAESLKHSSTVSFMNPLWVYCANHLTKLVVHDATTKASNALLSLLLAGCRFITFAYSLEIIARH